MTLLYKEEYVLMNSHKCLLLWPLKKIISKKGCASAKMYMYFR